MSSILDALEKANRERAAKRGDAPLTGDSTARQSVREKRLRQEADQQRHLLKIAIAVCVLVVLAAIGTVGWFMTRQGSSPAPLLAAEVTQQPAAPPEVQLAAPSLAPIPTPTPQETPLPTPIPTPEPTPEPTPTPIATPRPTPVPETPAVRTPRPVDHEKSFAGIFRDGQVIRQEELDLEITGVMELRSGFVAIINDKQIRAGQMYGTLHIIDIQFNLLTVDIGDGTIVKVRF